MKQKIIPIALTFDEAYVIPAGVAMYSLVKNANSSFVYELNVIHHGLSVRSQKKLINNLAEFQNCKIKFIYCDYSFHQEFKNLKNRQHFSPDMFYKLLLPSLLPNYDEIIVTDVDVLFQGDISSAYLNFNKDKYIAAVRHYSSHLISHLDGIYSNKEYKNKINKFGAGFLVCNLKKMRQDSCEEKMLNFLKENITNLVYPEQECINYVCSEKVEYLDLKYMVVKSWICRDLTENKLEEKYYFPYTKTQVVNALNCPVQIHFAGQIKPWKNINCEDLELWFKELCNTLFLNDYWQNFRGSLL